jgi:hypothetical protein
MESTLPKFLFKLRPHQESGGLSLPVSDRRFQQELISYAGPTPTVECNGGGVEKDLQLQVTRAYSVAKPYAILEW